MFILSNSIQFPPLHVADEDGLLAIGGDLKIERLLHAYQSGIFPWYNEDEPILWYSPDPRFVLFPSELKIHKSMQTVLKSTRFSFTRNQAFSKVIRACKQTRRAGQDGTWITDEMEQAYIRLHELGHAHSAECWQGNQLVGGLYGVRVGHVFCGESMFSLESNASKFAFIQMVQTLMTEGVTLIDCQVYTDHLASLGARLIARDKFVQYLT